MVKYLYIELCTLRNLHCYIFFIGVSIPKNKMLAKTQKLSEDVFMSV